LTVELKPLRDSEDNVMRARSNERQAAQPMTKKSVVNSFDKALLDVLMEVVNNLGASSTFVDLGCGDGKYLRTIIASGSGCNVIGVDVDIASLRVALQLDRSIGKTDISYVNCDVNSLPFCRKSITSAMMINVLHHVNSIKMLTTLKNLLRKNALFVIVEKVSDNPLNNLSLMIWPIIRYLFSYDSMKTEHLGRDLSIPFIRYHSTNTVTELLHHSGYQVKGILYNKCTVLLFLLYLLRLILRSKIGFFRLLEKSIVLIDEKIANFFGWIRFTVEAAWVCSAN